MTRPTLLAVLMLASLEKRQLVAFDNVGGELPSTVRCWLPVSFLSS